MNGLSCKVRGKRETKEKDKEMKNKDLSLSLLRSVTVLLGLIMLWCFSCVLLPCSAEQPVAFAKMSFEGHWKHESPAECGTIYQSVSIRRRGNVFEGGVSSGCGGGHIWFSELKGEIKENKLFARICVEEDDEENDKDFSKCMASPPNHYFVWKDGSLVWFTSTKGKWTEYLILQRAKEAKKAPKE